MFPCSSFEIIEIRGMRGEAANGIQYHPNRDSGPRTLRQGRQKLAAYLAFLKFVKLQMDGMARLANGAQFLRVEGWPVGQRMDP